jgi:hypothetical protein
MTTSTEHRLCQGLIAVGVFVAAVAAFVLFAVPVESGTVAAVRALAIFGGLAVAAGGYGITTGRVPMQPVAPMAAAPGALAGVALALSMSNAAPWVHVAMGICTAAGILGFALVAVGVPSDTP